MVKKNIVIEDNELFVLKPVEDPIFIIAYMNTTAYSIQAWQWGEKKFTVELHWRHENETLPGYSLESEPLIDASYSTRENAIVALEVWGREIKALEEREVASV